LIQCAPNASPAREDREGRQLRVDETRLPRRVVRRLEHDFPETGDDGSLDRGSASPGETEREAVVGRVVGEIVDHEPSAMATSAIFSVVTVVPATNGPTRWMADGPPSTFVAMRSSFVVGSKRSVSALCAPSGYTTVIFSDGVVRVAGPTFGSTTRWMVT